jgi:hypothetical protein
MADKSPQIRVSKQESASEAVESERATLIQLHAAEYLALTTRNTYWTTLQYALGPITAGAFVVLAEGRSFVPGILLSWSAAVFFDLIMLVYYGTVFEIFNNTRYLECELRKDVQGLMRKSDFWRYERYLRNRKAYPPWWDFVPMTFSVAAPLTTCLFRRVSWSTGDWVGLAICLIFNVMTLRLALGAVAAQGEFRREK